MYYFYGCGSTRILEKLYVKRSKNQKLIRGDETAMRKCKNAVRRLSTGRTNLVDRSNYLLESSMHTSTGRSPYVDRSNMLLESIPRTSTGRTIIADRSNPPDVRKVSRSNIERDFLLCFYRLYGQWLILQSRFLKQVRIETILC